MQLFWLTKRALHVYSEASRVLAFERACNLSKGVNSNTLEELAALMNESHRSCRDQFECSCPGLIVFNKF